jgi:hypothetical protein
MSGTPDRYSGIGCRPRYDMKTRMGMNAADYADLKEAKDLLENPGLAAKITNLLGLPVEKGFAMLPERWTEAVQQATRKSMRKALDFAVNTMKDKPGKPASNRMHKLIAAADGAAAGAFGLPALIVELPVTTTVMLRSIADVARSMGERVRSIDSRLACLEVFALGGSSPKDNATETGYFAVRAALARTVSEAAKYIAERGLAEEGAPPLVRLIVSLSSRFGLVVSEKVAAQAIPVIGAAGGALINTLFIDHFQDMARGHFTIRRLERTYGPDEVRRLYDCA